MGLHHFLCVVVCLLFAACIPGEPNLEGRPCPCLDGAYVCIDEVCVLASEVDAGPDTMFDARQPVDGSTDVQDAGPDIPQDGGPQDAGAGDTGDDAEADASTADAGEDTGPMGTFCERHGAGAYECLDFETDYTTLGWNESTSESATIAVSEERSISGRSLRSMVGMGGFAAIAKGVTPPPPGGTMWLRAQFFAESPNEILFWSLMAVGGVTAMDDLYAHAVINTDRRLFVSHRNQTDEVNATTTETFRAGDWFCLELSIDLVADGDFVLYLDGTEVVRRPVDSAGSWNRLTLGNVGTNMMQPISSVFVDDYVWSPTRVPCNLR